MRRKLVKSFAKNYYLKPHARISFLIQQKYVSNEQQFFWGQNKLQC
jgi:hypothetical protein